MSKKSKSISRNKSLIRLFLIICLALVTVATVMSFTSPAQAADDMTATEKAREKKYLGGKDEGDLRVLPAVANSKSKRPKTDDADEGF